MATREGPDIELRSRGPWDRWWAWLLGGVLLALALIALAEIPLFLDDWTSPLNVRMAISGRAAPT